MSHTDLICEDLMKKVQNLAESFNCCCVIKAFYILHTSWDNKSFERQNHH